MNREEAANSIQLEIDRIEDNQAYEQMSKSMYEDGYRRIEALVIAMKALRSGWVRTSERVPEGDDDDYVLTWNRFGYIAGPDCRVNDVGFLKRNQEQFPYWMPLPKLPEVKG